VAINAAAPRRYAVVSRAIIARSALQFLHAIVAAFQRDGKYS